MRHENICCLIVDKQTFSQVVADINNVQVISVPQWQKSSIFIFQVLVSFLLLPLIVPVQMNEWYHNRLSATGGEVSEKEN